jgi:hypothetical protein
VAEIFISPLMDDAVKVAATVVHELIHAAIGTKHGHDPKFAAKARAMLLDGKPTATFASEAFKQRVAPLLEQVGAYPHSRMEPGLSGRKKQSTRLMKVICNDCGYNCRVTRKWLDNVGPPHCPVHGEMEVDG